MFCYKVTVILLQEFVRRQEKVIQAAQKESANLVQLSQARQQELRMQRTKVEIEKEKEKEKERKREKERED